MPIQLDPNLPESLYPLAWLIGSWSGHGAVQLREADGSAADRRIEQTLQCSATEEGTLAWSMGTELIDAPAPLPPTSAFAKDPLPAESQGTGEHTLLLRERGIWRVGDPLPGQDLAAARRAAPGDPRGHISYALDVELETEGVARHWQGEVRGPRIQLALHGDGAPVSATRMFGYVGGRLMWLWERLPMGTTEDDKGLAPYLSVELDRD